MWPLEGSRGGCWAAGLMLARLLTPGLADSACVRLSIGFFRGDSHSKMKVTEFHIIQNRKALFELDQKEPLHDRRQAGILLHSCGRISPPVGFLSSPTLQPPYCTSTTVTMFVASSNISLHMDTLGKLQKGILVGEGSQYHPSW